VEEKIAETAKKQEESVVKIKAFTKTAVGEKLTSGEVLEPEEMKELADSIPAPIPMVESKDSKGGI
jgi:hypothetical protein